MATDNVSINNPYEAPKAEVSAKREPDVLRPASCGYTLAVVLLGIVAGVMFIVMLGLLVVLILQWAGVSIF